MGTDGLVHSYSHLAFVCLYYSSTPFRTRRNLKICHAETHSLTHIHTYTTTTILSHRPVKPPQLEEPACNLSRHQPPATDLNVKSRNVPQGTRRHKSGQMVLQHVRMDPVVLPAPVREQPEPACGTRLLPSQHDLARSTHWAVTSSVSLCWYAVLARNIHQRRERDSWSVAARHDALYSDWDVQSQTNRDRRHACTIRAMQHRDQHAYAPPTPLAPLSPS